MTSANRTRNEPGRANALETQSRLPARVLPQAKFISFFGGLLLLFAGWSMGNQAITNQSIAIVRGFTACGLLLAGGLSLVSAAIAYHRE